MGRPASLVVWCLLVTCAITGSAVATPAGTEAIDAPGNSDSASTGPSSTGPAVEPTAAAGTVDFATAVGGSVTQTAGPDSAPGVSVAVERVSTSELRVTATYDVPSTVDDLRVIIADADLREAEGFERCGSNRLCWDGSTEPTLILSHDLTAYAGTYTGIVNESVAFVPAPRVYTAWRTATERRTAPLFAKREYASYRIAGDRTVVGNATLFHGPHTEYERTANGTTFRLITPEGVTLGPSRERLFDALTGASRALDVGGVNREVIVVALADTPQSTEFGLAGATVGNAFWARADSSLRSTHNVWIHEYVHTRQRFADRGREMEWFIEASAEYYAARLSYELGLVSDIEYEWEMKSRRVSASDSVLAEPSTWDRPNVPYRKGALTLAALDAEIRSRTDGERSLEDVFRRLNRADRTLTYDLFVETVVSVSGDPALENWLDRYVTEPATPQYEPQDPQGRLPNPPQMSEVATLVPTTPLGFGAAALGLALATMLALSVLSTIGRSLQRLVETVFDGLRWLAEFLVEKR